MQLESSKPYPVPEHDPSSEKWVDLDGTNTFFLRMLFGSKKEPITEVNFFNITTKSDARFVSQFCYVVNPLEIWLRALSLSQTRRVQPAFQFSAKGELRPVYSFDNHLPRPLRFEILSRSTASRPWRLRQTKQPFEQRTCSCFRCLQEKERLASCWCHDCRKKRIVEVPRPQRFKSYTVLLGSQKTADHGLSTLQSAKSQI